MKKKILAFFMAISAAVCCTVCLAACGDGSDGSEGDILPPHAPSEGLEYELIENGREYNDYANHYIDLGVDGACYAVTGTGKCTNTDLVIPATHDGLPVVMIGRVEIEYNNNDNTYINTKYPHITSVYIPDEITYVGAFMHCKKLKSVRIGKNTVFWQTQNEGLTAFAGCPLEKITVAKGNKNYYSKNNCVIETESKALIIGTANSVIPADGSVTSIYPQAFFGCTSLTNITIPGSVTEIGYRAFSDCTSLTNITIPDGVTEIGTYVFYGCSSLTGITIPRSVASIGFSAFSHCSSLSDITIPDSVIEIESYAFYRCSSLTGITIPRSVTDLGQYAFSYCTALSSVTIPDSVTDIGNSAFYGCTALSSVTIPNSVNYISSSLFYGCTALSNVTIPNSVSDIGSSAFYGCTALSGIDFKGTKAQWKATEKGSSWNGNTGNYTVQCTNGKLDKEGNEVS